MALAATVRSSEVALEAADKATPSARSSELAVEVAYKIPAAFTRDSEIALESGWTRAADILYESELAVEIAWRGRIANPALRIWTCTLDTHDFVFLRLGDDSTLVYDLYSEQWVDWDTKNNGAWRPNVGMTWIGAEALAPTYGTNIVAGDDNFGLLWFLDPDAPYDETPYVGYMQQIDFDRVVTGQVLTTGRQYIPCYALFLDGDNYGLVATDFTPAVTLETSDDQGRTFILQGTLTVTPDFQQNNPYIWLSLGQISSPGRMFRITDNGVFTRIDSLEMNDDAG